MRRRNFSTSCLTENSSSFLDIGTKFKPLLRTDFSASESGRFSGKVTTVLRLSNDESQVIGGPVNFSSFNLVEMIEKFRIDLLNFGANR